MFHRIWCYMALSYIRHHMTPAHSEKRNEIFAAMADAVQNEFPAQNTQSNFVFILDNMVRNGFLEFTKQNKNLVRTCADVTIDEIARNG